VDFNNYDNHLEENKRGLQFRSREDLRKLKSDPYVSLKPDFEHELLVNEHGNYYIKTTNANIFDIDSALAFALGTSRDLHDDIDALYAKSVHDETLLETSKMHSTFIDCEIRARKAYILLKEEGYSLQGSIYSLINKGYKSSVRFYKNRRICIIEEFIATVTNQNTNFIALREHGGMICLLFMAIANKDTHIYGAVDTFDRLSYGFTNDVRLSSVPLGGSKSAQKDFLLSEGSKEIKKFWWFKEDSMTFLEYSSHLTDRSTKGKLNETSFGSLDRTQVLSTSYLRSYIMIGNILSLFDYHLNSDIGGAIVTKEDVQIILGVLDSLKLIFKLKEGNADDEVGSTIVLCLTFLIYLREIDNLRSFYVDNQESKAKKHKSEVDRLIQVLSTKDYEILELSRRSEGLTGLLKEKSTNNARYTSNLESKVLDLEEKLANYEQLKLEVVTLREQVYLDNQTTEDFAIPEEKMLSELSKFRIAVVGGHPKWGTKLKNSLPNVDFYDILDSLGRDISGLKGYDYVFLFTSYCSHSLHAKLIAEVKEKLKYLSNHRNLDLALRDIYTGIKQG
jgi:hypothetical protein